MSHPPDEPPLEPQRRAAWRPEDFADANMQGGRAPQRDPDGCFVVAGKIILTLFLGIFVLGSLVFATCFLSLR